MVPRMPFHRRPDHKKGQPHRNTNRQSVSQRPIVLQPIPSRKSQASEDEQEARDVERNGCTRRETCSALELSPVCRMSANVCDDALYCGESVYVGFHRVYILARL